MKTILLCVALVTACAGCSSLPGTKVNFKSPFGELNLNSEKQTQWEDVDVTIAKDGSVVAHIGKVKAENSADVIAAQSAANAKTVDSVVNGLTKAIEVGAEAGAKGALKGATGGVE